MFEVKVTAIYAAILGIAFTAITLRVAMYRISKKVSLGHLGDKELEKLIRAHANFAETVPIALLLILMLELQDVSAVTLHLFGLVLTMGRLLHYLQLTGVIRPIIYRTAGMIMTLGTIFSAATSLLFSVT